MFIEEHLHELRRDRFRPGALALYLRRVAGRIRENIVTNPAAVRSVWSAALGYFAFAFAGAGVMALVSDRRFALDLFLATALAILPTFALVTFHLEFLRDRDGHRLSGLNLPTILTLARPVLLPGIVLAMAEHRFALALGLYVAAMASDVADGWLARRWGQITVLGKVLDPLVDIVFHLVIFVGLWSARLVPAWVFVAAAARYGILLVGGAYLYLFVGPVRIQPTAFGRATGVAMAALVGLLALLHVLDGPLAERLLGLTEAALGVLMIATVGQVIALGWYNLKVMRREAAPLQGRVVGDVRWDGR